MDMNKGKLYHEVLQMSPLETEALKEAGRQIIGMDASPHWPKMLVDKPVVHHGHYRRWIDMPSNHEIAAALQRDTGSGFFDSLKHGFGTVVRNARKVHGAVQQAVGIGKKVAQGVSNLPVIGKYAGKAVDVLQGVEHGLEMAEKGIRIAEGLDRRINPVAAPVPVDNSIAEQPEGRPNNPFIRAEGQQFGRVPRKSGTVGSISGAGLVGRGLVGRGLGGGIPGGRFGSRRY